jgi:hypothetical protein
LLILLLKNKNCCAKAAMTIQLFGKKGRKRIQTDFIPQKNAFKVGRGVGCWRFGDYSSQFCFFLSNADSAQRLLAFLHKSINFQHIEIGM